MVCGKTMQNPLKRRLTTLACALVTLFLVVGCGVLSASPTTAPAAVPTSAQEVPYLTSAPAVPGELPTSEPNPFPTADLHNQLEQIDQALRQQISGSIAYNKPDTMDLGQTATIELLLNPSLSEGELGPQVSEPGSVQTATIEITPQMKAVLLSPLPEAFSIQPIQEPVQLISATETTRWSWAVTARKSGTQRLVLVISRLVKYEGQDYWREVETYQADIQITVPLSQRITSVDWKWLISVVVAVISLPFIWRLFSRRKKEQ
jgi:hypothetical protein